jgi:ribonuclease HI
VEAGELPLELRRQQLAMQYITKLRSNPANPAFGYVFNTSFRPLFEARPSITPTLGIRLHENILESGVNLDNIAGYTIPHIPPWTLKAPSFQLDLQLLGSKCEVPPTVYQSKFNEIVSQFSGYTRIFTDGSQIGEAVGAAAILESNVSCKRLPNNSSIFSAEARGLLLALDMIRQTPGGKFLFLTDSLSCLQSLQSCDLSQPLISEILCRVHGLLSRSTADVVFMWVPSHVGLAGNTAADTAAKASLTLPVSNLTVPHSDYNSLIRVHMVKKWQQSWNSECTNKLHVIQPVVNVTQSYRLPRRDEILIHRLRIGHTYLTHGHLLRGETPPQCDKCQVELTVEHILLGCSSLANVRAQYFTVSSLSELFLKVFPCAIIDFIKEIGLYRKI